MNSNSKKLEKVFELWQCMKGGEKD